MKNAASLAHRFKDCVVIVVLLVAAVIYAAAQQTRPPAPIQPPLPDSSTPDVWEQQQQKRMAEQANLQRQQDIRKDTAKLLELATELKQAVDKSNENTLSLDVVKKAEQIEKLAKTVKEKMKGP